MKCRVEFFHCLFLLLESFLPVSRARVHSHNLATRFLAIVYLCVFFGLYCWYATAAWRWRSRPYYLRLWLYDYEFPDNFDSLSATSAIGKTMSMCIFASPTESNWPSHQAGYSVVNDGLKVRRLLRLLQRHCQCCVVAAQGDFLLRKSKRVICRSAVNYAILRAL